MELTRKALLDISRTPLYGSDGNEFRRRFSALRQMMFDTRAQFVALHAAFDAVAEFLANNDGIRADYMEEFVMSYCALSSELAHEQ